MSWVQNKGQTLGQSPTARSGRAGTGIQSDRPLYHCSASSFVFPVHVREPVSVPAANAGHRSPFPSRPLNDTLFSKANSASCFKASALALPTGPEQGKNLAQRPLEFLCHFKKIASMDSPLSVYFGKGGEDGEVGGKEQKFSRSRASQGLGTSSERTISTVSFLNLFVLVYFNKHSL